MKQIDKGYQQPFLLEPTKLTRLVDKIHERLSEHTDTTTHDSFEVFLSGNRHETMQSVDLVLALENSRKHRIQRLVITSSASAAGAIRPEHEVQVDFGAVKFVGVSVRSDAPGWANRTLSEVEEQVERTWIRYRTPVAALMGLLCILVVSIAALFIQFNYVPSTSDVIRPMWLRSGDVDRVEQMVGQNRTITDEEMREIESRQLRNILDDYKPQQPPPKGYWRKVLLILVPLITLVICAVILLNSYPSWIFLWGDEVERYAAVVQRRRFIWNVVIGIVVVGVVGNLLSARVLSLFSK
jgi:hypothetical protein